MFQKKEKPQDKILEIITPQIGIFQIENISGERRENPGGFCRELDIIMDCESNYIRIEMKI
jgi:hypothetical protein